MKKDIHPTYNIKSEAACACGQKFAVGSTKDSLSVEICSQCHPFYTGNDKVLDNAGRVERFKRLSSSAKKTKK